MCINMCIDMCMDMCVIFVAMQVRRGKAGDLRVLEKNARKAGGGAKGKQC